MSTQIFFESRNTAVCNDNVSQIYRYVLTLTFGEDDIAMYATHMPEPEKLRFLTLLTLCLFAPVWCGIHSLEVTVSLLFSSIPCVYTHSRSFLYEIWG